MLSQKHVDDYIELYESGAIKLNRDRIDMVEWVKRVVLIQKHFYFDEKQIENCISFIEQYFFKLEPFQKFLIAFVFLFDPELDEVVFDEHFWTLARGGGKNGLISGLSAYFISEAHGIHEYNVAITANSGEQAEKSFIEVYNMLKKNPGLEEEDYFRKTKEKIFGLDTNSTLETRTSNADTKDSFADGALFFDEVHGYETNDIIEVQTSGLGKVQYGRTFFVGTNGFIRDGVYDQLIERSRLILMSDELTDTMFPFICTLDDNSEVEDPANWEKANPMFCQPRSVYANRLYNRVLKQWNRLKSGIGDKAKWLVKRMNIQDVKMISNVASKKEIRATNREYGDLTGLPCIGSVDFSSVKDFTAVGLLFKRDEEYIWKSHSYVLKKFLEVEAIPAPIEEWEEEGLLTKIEGDLITEEQVAEWFLEQRKYHSFDTIVIDNYRQSTLKPVLEKYGFNVEVIRRSPGVQATIGTMIESLFAKQLLIFGSPTMMNWYTNNVYVKRDKDGNMRFEKKEEIKRKTDGFMAFIHALFKSMDLFPQITVGGFDYDETWIF